MAYGDVSFGRGQTMREPTDCTGDLLRSTVDSAWGIYTAADSLTGSIKTQTFMRLFLIKEGYYVD